MRWLMVLAALAGGVALAEEPDPHAACGGGPGGPVPAELLERPVKLRSGIGHVHEKVTTRSAEAQAFYDQGLAYIHSYVWIEAVRSFHQALRADPQLAMAELGKSRGYSGLEDPPSAQAALARAQALAAGASEWERQRIALRAIQLDAMADRANAEKHQKYKAALDEALASRPGDAELWILRGNAEEAQAGGRGQRGKPASIAFYEAALARVPNHLGAHHYLVHTYETNRQVALALEHGKPFAAQARDVPHAVHMYAHDLRRVGRVDEAIRLFERARALELAYYERENVPAKYDWHHLHNLALLGTSYQFVGRMADAERTLAQMFAAEPTLENVDVSRLHYPEFLLLRGRLDEAAAAATKMATGGRFAATRAVGHAFAGQVAVVAGRWDDARRELAAAEKEAEGEIGIGELPLPRSSVVAHIDVLRGELLLHDGKTAEGRALLADVQKRIRAAPGADAWIAALYKLEGIARFALQSGDLELAAEGARQMLEHDPAYAGTHLLLARLALGRGDAETARNELKRAKALWRHADRDLLAEAGGTMPR